VFDAVSDREYRDERYARLRSGEELPDMAGWFQRYYRAFFRYDVDAIHRDFPREQFAPPEDDGITRKSPVSESPVSVEPGA
jgi:hypothetical protein